MCYKPKLVDVGRFLGLGYPRYKFAPCGCCIECRNMRREEYTQRLKHEIMMNDYVASFVTLTYRDDELPLLLPKGSAVVGKYFGSVPPAYGSTLSRKDLKQFCDKLTKRFRRKYGKLPFKYIAVGEYGDDGHRPHYHLIIVGLPAGERRMVYEAWNKGRVDIEPVGNGAIRYCLEYIDKQVFGANTLYEEYGDFQPPFALFSKGIGESWIQKNINHFDDYGTIHFGSSGKSYTLNPYYRRKYMFKTKEYTTPYSDSVVKFAVSNHLSLPEAYKKRCEYMETKLIHKQINNREPIYRVTRALIDKTMTSYMNKHNVDKRSKWYRDITKALLNVDKSYIPDGSEVLNNSFLNPLSSATNPIPVYIHHEKRNLLNKLSSMPLRDRVSLMQEYNKFHPSHKRAVKYLTNYNSGNIISNRN